MENTNEEAMVVRQDEAIAAIDENEDANMTAVLKLPGYDSMTPTQVAKGVKDVFKGFDQANAGGSTFADTAALADYAARTMEDIKKADSAATKSMVLFKAAALARFWYLGQTVNQALSNGQYGTGAVNKLATQLGKKVTYIYQLRAVATRLTVVDCYLLGLRMLDTTHLRKLSQVKDDAIRRGIIETFIAAVPDSSDKERYEAARAQLISALNAKQVETIDDVGTSDPLNGGTDTSVSPEYDAVIKQMVDWSKMLHKPSLEGPIEELCSALDNFFLSADVPDAEKRLATVKDTATAMKALMQSVKNNLDDAIRSLDSVMAVELNTNA